MNTARRFKMLLAAVVVALSAVVIAQDAGKFTDKRDGKTYKKVTIGKQTWMAENLNYDVPNVDTDVCYKNEADNCVKYGRLYDWKTALKACPAGWHLPSDAEWTTLTDYAGGASTAGEKLKSTSGWDDNGNGTDKHGFSAMPGGDGIGGNFDYAGYYGRWWSATDGTTSNAWFRLMYYYDERVNRNYNYKASLFSVRCVLNEKEDQK